ncbi:hypothetical protein [Natrinema salifodinae]|uniref:Uncharacterized protein n=1 Tax=Natrinema salifodinae TaxID=1202768 RepID=A0A1I0NCB4_9EURY|nr:hypothetical protein [Natrinema salifodinae]SEV98997.1 hypothetical protein SAMN05216285_1582 [Natrinema salifodinae]
MRLTPSRFHTSSTGTTEEGTGESKTGSGVTFVYEPREERSESGADSDDGDRASELLPATDTELLAVLDDLDTPVTVDELADELIGPRRPPIETWAGVHERLCRHRLPALDASGALSFDESQGLIERSTASPDRASETETPRFVPAIVALISFGAVFGAAAFVSTSLLVALTVTLLTSTFAAWIVPAFV